MADIEENKKIARDYIAQVFNAHRPDLGASFVTPDVVWHGNTLGEIKGVENVTGLLTGFIGALPDLEAVEKDVVAENDLVMVRLVVTATHKGDLLGVKATDRRITWDAIDVYRITDGKISEEWASDDMVAFGHQIGAFIAPWIA